MLWWLIVLSILVLYLLIKVYQILTWLLDYYNKINQHFIDCGCQVGEAWPPPKPPPFP